MRKFHSPYPSVAAWLLVGLLLFLLASIVLLSCFSRFRLGLLLLLKCRGIADKVFKKLEKMYLKEYNKVRNS